MMRASPYQLYTFNTQGQELFLVALTNEEAKTIRKERGLRLEPCDDAKAM